MTTRESIQATLDAIDPVRPVALFLRHAARETILPTEPYADVDLTQAGLEEAQELGRSTCALLSWTAVSPFRRCRRTAEALHGSAPEVDERLGVPGPWVIDDEKGRAWFAELGTHHLVRAQLGGRRFDGLRELGEGTQRLLSAGLDRIDAGRGSGACVSHDAVLVPALGWLTGNLFQDDWVHMLEGFAVQRTAAGIVCIWRGQRYERTAW